MNERGATSPPGRRLGFLQRFAWAGTWMIAFMLLGNTWFRCGGPFGMDAPTAEAFVAALGHGGALMIFVVLGNEVTPGGRRGGSWRPWTLLRRRLRWEGGLPVGVALWAGVVLVLAVWFHTVAGYERGLYQAEHGSCAVAQALPPGG